MGVLLIKNGLVIRGEEQGVRDILIQGQKIEAVSDHIRVPESAEVIDASGKWIFPGAIDPHTHMGIPIKSGFSADDFATGSRSALHGGVTTILDFTVLEKGQSLSDSLGKRQKLAQEAVCDVGIHVNITRFDPQILEEIPDLIQRGYSSFKVFTTYSEADMMLSYEQIEAVAEVIGKHSGILMVHAEDDDTLKSAQEAYSNRLETHPRHHGLSRPGLSEKIAVRKLGKISQRTQCTIYIVHLNTADGLKEALQYANLKIETCPHYLLLTAEAYEREDGRMFVASPPLRTVEDSKALWEGIKKGQIHTLGSDHCPFCQRDKIAGIPFQDIPNGMGGVETLFPVMLAQFIERGIDLSLLVRLTSQSPSQIFYLDHVKGDIKPGLHADLLIVDPNKHSTDWESGLDTGMDWNAYGNFPAVFPDMVIRRGEIVCAQGKIINPSPGTILKSNSGHQK